MMRASDTFSSSMAAFQSLTELGTNSSERRSTAFLRASCCSSSAACSHTLTEVGMCSTALARMDLATSTGCRRAASSHTSSESGHISQPCRMILRACGVLEAYSSTRAAAIQPGPCLGLVVVTDCSRMRAFLMSPTSASLFTLRLLRLVRYPLGSTTVWPLTESDILSSRVDSAAPRASAARPEMMLWLPPNTLLMPPREVSVPPTEADTLLTGAASEEGLAIR
mmetsp:Transcript_24624/g.33791  ORF Transcript_24624/g.33791 Transcript_24624/m.33791 type:complete len:224 (-) Transcript_24624:722-1393(-)